MEIIINGKREYIFAESDILSLVERYMGKDFTAYLKSDLVNTQLLQDEIDRLIEEINTYKEENDELEAEVEDLEEKSFQDKSSIEKINKFKSDTLNRLYLKENKNPLSSEEKNIVHELEDLWYFKRPY